MEVRRSPFRKDIEQWSSNFFLEVRRSPFRKDIEQWSKYQPRMLDYQKERSLNMFVEVENLEVSACNNEMQMCNAFALHMNPYNMSLKLDTEVTKWQHGVNKS